MNDSFFLWALGAGGAGKNRERPCKMYNAK